MAWSGFFALLEKVSSLLLMLVDHYLGSFTPFEFSVELKMAAGFLIFMLVWAGFWGLIGRVTRHEAHFVAHFSVILLGCLISYLYWIVIPFSEFYLGTGLAAAAVKKVFGGLVLVGLFWMTFYLAFSLSRLQRTLLANGVAWGVVILLNLLTYKDREFEPAPDYNATLKPPLFLFGPAVTPADYWQSCEQLFSEVRWQSEEAK